MTGVLTKRVNLDTKTRITEKRQCEDTQGEDNPMTGMAHLPAEDCQLTPAARRSKEGVSPRTVNETTNTWISDSWPPEL